MIKHIFECIKQRILENIPEIKDVRVYNGQDVFSDEHTPFHSPSVFVDFTNIEYETIGYGTQDAEVTLNVMLFHEEFTLNHLEVFELNSEINTFLAISEIISHLIYLEHQGKIERIEKNGKFLFVS